jgi:hypothetical protein
MSIVARIKTDERGWHEAVSLACHLDVEGTIVAKPQTAFMSTTRALLGDQGQERRLHPEGEEEQHCLTRTSDGRHYGYAPDSVIFDIAMAVPA